MPFKSDNHAGGLHNRETRIIVVSRLKTRHKNSVIQLRRRRFFLEYRTPFVIKLNKRRQPIKLVFFVCSFVFAKIAMPNCRL